MAISDTLFSCLVATILLENLPIVVYVKLGSVGSSLVQSPCEA